MKKMISVFIATSLAALLFAGCAGSGAAAPSNPGGNFSPSAPLTVLSREDGSGTRGAFIELFGIEEDQEDGSTLDRTTLEAVTVNSTSVMTTTVAGDPHAIGYISLGSLDSSVKALEIDGAAPTVENIKSGSYPVSRPFNIATQKDLSAVAQDFIDFILSSEGQAIVEENGYIPLESASAYSGGKPSGRVVIAGSSSVTPVMEKLAEAYATLNPSAETEIQQSDSSTGMSAALDGICDIGMASRELKDSELEAGLSSTVIAIDGIAVIVNNANPLTGLTSAQVRQVYTGELTSWSALS